MKRLWYMMVEKKKTRLRPTVFLTEGKEEEDKTFIYLDKRRRCRLLNAQTPPTRWPMGTKKKEERNYIGNLLKNKKENLTMCSIYIYPSTGWTRTARTTYSPAAKHHKHYSKLSSRERPAENNSNNLTRRRRRRSPIAVFKTHAGRLPKKSRALWR